MKSKEIRKMNRKSNFLQVAPANYLIICEGVKTEPNYFNGLRKEISKKYGDKVDVLNPSIDVKGTGRNTLDLVRYTQEFVNYSNKVYGQVWVVFDKDNYDDEQFDKAIKDCNYNVAWSNPNFELWLLVHLKKVARYISKEEILKELDKQFRKKGFEKYSKNDKNIFRKISSLGNLDKAMRNCVDMENLNSTKQASKRNPMTKVYKIVEGLKEYL